MNKLFGIVFFLALFVGLYQAQAVLDTDAALKNPGLKNVQAATFATVSLGTAVASTGAVIVTDLAGRDYLEIRAGALAGQEIWVGIDTNPTVGVGMCVTSAEPLRLPIPAGKVIKTIASGAWPMAVFQGAY